MLYFHHCYNPEMIVVPFKRKMSIKTMVTYYVVHKHFAVWNKKLLKVAPICVDNKAKSISSLLKINFEDIGHVCGATNTPVLDYY